MISIGEVYVVIPLLRREGRAGTSGAFGASFAAVFLEALHRNAVLSTTAIRAVSVEGFLLDCSLCNDS